MARGAESRFVCPACLESIDVDAEMRAALLENGCVVCGSRVTVEAFC